MKRSSFPKIISILVLVFFYVPILLLILQSFNESKFGGAWGGFTFKWYGKLMEDRAIWMALKNTLTVALVSTVVSMVLGTLAAWVINRYQTGLQKVHSLFVHAPLLVPDILMGISLLLVFANLKVKLGLDTIILAHITFCLSYVTLVVLGRLQDFDLTVVDAAQDLGAGWGTIIRRILLPMLGPGIAAGGMLAFTLSIDDFVITFFVSGPGSTTLPVHVYSMMKHGTPTLINALSVILMVVTFVVVLVSQKFMEKKI